MGLRLRGMASSWRETFCRKSDRRCTSLGTQRQRAPNTGSWSRLPVLEAGCSATRLESDRTCGFWIREGAVRVVQANSQHRPFLPPGERARFTSNSRCATRPAGSTTAIYWSDSSSDRDESEGIRLLLSGAEFYHSIEDTDVDHSCFTQGLLMKSAIDSLLHSTTVHSLWILARRENPTSPSKGTTGG